MAKLRVGRPLAQEINKCICKCHLRTGRTCLLECDAQVGESSPLGGLVPLFVRGAATSRTDGNNESERGQECVREAGALSAVRRGDACSRFPGEECQHEQQSLLAAIHPLPPRPASGTV